jgi:ubiquinone/menaquinone biosynthesis C-methylase UbiE
MTVELRELADAEPPLDAEALKIFQHQWEIYQKALTFDYLSHKRVLQTLHGVLLAEGERPFTFLDLACGDAFGIAETLAGAAVARYVGVDLAMPALRLAEKRLNGAAFPVTLLHGDLFAAIERLPEPFDFVWCGLCIHHLQTPDK